MDMKVLENYVIDIEDSIYYAHWKLHKNKNMLVVLENGKYCGVITFREIYKTYKNANLTIRDICNYNGKYVNDGERMYEDAKWIFYEFENINLIPVIDEERNLVEILSRQFVFWKKHFDARKLPRMHYADCIWSAAYEAKNLGYTSMSVIEYGVAGGAGLLNCEFHARAVSRILGISIEVYGFDSAQGLPMENRGYKDMVHIWPGGAYSMDYTGLLEKLRCAKLVIGDVAETSKTFFDDYKPAPIGVMLIDVDYYSSTVPVLKMLEADHSHFLPRIQMYCDDTSYEYEFSGENLAIKEFNATHADIKISPEGMADERKFRQKTCHRFSHPKYNEKVNIFKGRVMEGEYYELPMIEIL